MTSAVLPPSELAAISDLKRRVFDLERRLRKTPTFEPTGFGALEGAVIGRGDNVWPVTSSFDNLGYDVIAYSAGLCVSVGEPAPNPGLMITTDTLTVNEDGIYLVLVQDSFVAGDGTYRSIAVMGAGTALAWTVGISGTAHPTFVGGAQLAQIHAGQDCVVTAAHDSSAGTLNLFYNVPLFGILKVGEVSGFVI